MVMKTWICCATTLLLYGNVLWAQESESSDAEATIRLMGVAEAALPDAVTKEISLPQSLADDSAAVDNATNGLEKANANRARRDDGVSRADEARERGAEIAEEAQQNRESRGRSGDRPDPPDPPDPPGPPEQPGPPGN